MKKIKIMGIALTLFLVGLVNVKAATVVEVADADTFKTCVATKGNTCKLTSDIPTTEMIELKDDVTIDLNGNNISTETAAKIFEIRKGAVNITGTGKLISTVGHGIAIYGSTNSEDANYTVVTIGKNVTVEVMGYAAYVSYNTTHAYGVVVNIDGTLNGKDYGAFYVNGSIQDTTGNYPVININDGAVLKSENGVGIYAGGYAEWNVNEASISGYGLGLGIKAGDFTIDGTTISSNGKNYADTIEEWGNGMNHAGAAIQIETNANYADQIEIDIKNGTFTSEKGYAFLEYVGKTNIVGLTIENGTFNSASGLDVFKVTNNFNLTKFITGGTYSSDVTKYLADGLEWNSETGKVTEIVYSQDVDMEEIDTTKEVEEVTVGVTNAAEVQKTLIEELNNSEINVENKNVKVVVSIENNQKVDEKVSLDITDSLVKEHSNAKVAEYFDITLSVVDTDNNDDLGNLTELSKSIKLSVVLPTELQKVADGYTRTYYIVRQHGDEIKVLNATLSEDGKSLIFETDRFSTYALAYEDTAIVETDNPKTSDNITLYIALGSLSIMGLAIAGLYVNKKRLFN